ERRCLLPGSRRFSPISVMTSRSPHRASRRSEGQRLLSSSDVHRLRARTTAHRWPPLSGEATRAECVRGRSLGHATECSFSTKHPSFLVTCSTHCASRLSHLK